MRNNILITGSHGFIASRIEGGKKFHGNINSYYLLRMQAAGTEGIVHLAAKSSNNKCIEDPRKTIESNLLGLSNILEVALINNLWVLFISTYQVSEQTFYGLSKLMGEELCRVYKSKGLKVHILRLPIVYGENDSQDKIVTKFIKQLKQGIEPKIDTDKEFYFNYIDDVIRIIEEEVNVISCRRSTMKKHTLTELTDGIKKCLELERGKDD